jgi:hypothetical protein
MDDRQITDQQEIREYAHGRHETRYAASGFKDCPAHECAALRAGMPPRILEIARQIHGRHWYVQSGSAGARLVRANGCGEPACAELISELHRLIEAAAQRHREWKRAHVVIDETHVHRSVSAPSTVAADAQRILTALDADQGVTVPEYRPSSRTNDGAVVQGYEFVGMRNGVHMALQHSGGVSVCPDVLCVHLRSTGYGQAARDWVQGRDEHLQHVHSDAFTACQVVDCAQVRLKVLRGLGRVADGLTTSRSRQQAIQAALLRSAVHGIHDWPERTVGGGVSATAASACQDVMCVWLQEHRAPGPAERYAALVDQHGKHIEQIAPGVSTRALAPFQCADGTCVAMCRNILRSIERAMSEESGMMLPPVEMPAAQVAPVVTPDPEKEAAELVGPFDTPAELGAAVHRNLRLAHKAWQGKDYRMASHHRSIAHTLATMLSSVFIMTADDVVVMPPVPESKHWPNPRGIILGSPRDTVTTVVGYVGADGRYWYRGDLSDRWLSEDGAVKSAHDMAQPCVPVKCADVLHTADGGVWQLLSRWNSTRKAWVDVWVDQTGDRREDRHHGDMSLCTMVKLVSSKGKTAWEAKP